MIAKLLTVSDILIGRIFYSRSNPNLFALKSRNFFQQYCCSKYDETLKNEYKWRTHFQNHAPRPKINPFETFHPFSYPLEDPNCQMWKDLERTRSISFRLLLRGKERDLDSGEAKDPRLESRMKSDTRVTLARIRWTTMAWNSEETIKLGEFRRGIPEGRDSKRS